MVRSTV
jgi:hypothetical protein